VVGRLEVIDGLVLAREFDAELNDLHSPRLVLGEQLGRAEMTETMLPPHLRCNWQQLGDMTL
jgi:hypothetical protein